MKGFSAEEGEGCVSPKSDLRAVNTIDNVVLAARQKQGNAAFFSVGLDPGNMRAWTCLGPPA